jgi:hypothetical protein
MNDPKSQKRDILKFCVLQCGNKQNAIQAAENSKSILYFILVTEQMYYYIPYLQLEGKLSHKILTFSYYFLLNPSIFPIP